MRFIPLLSLLALLPSLGLAQQPWFFAVMSDPQFGMYTDNRNFTQETANFEFAIANANRLHPKFLVICGDLTNQHGNLKQIAEYKRILRELDPSIPVYSVPGNHDVGNTPTPQTLDAYRSNIGRDYYTFSAPGILGIVLNSNLIRSPEDAPDAAKKQEQWLESVLEKAKSNPGREVVVFQHIPYFQKSAGEKEGYFNIPLPARRKYLDLLERGGVKYVFAGHLHHNAEGTDGPLTEIVTGAVGKPLGGSLSGFRIVAVNGQKLDSTWFCFGGIPNQIDLQKPMATPCPQ